MSLDVIGIPQKESREMRKIISDRTGLPFESIFIACTHTHLGPTIYKEGRFTCDDAYNSVLFRRLADGVQYAIENMHPAEIRIARGKAENISFVRRYRMKDGSTRTNPGNDPNVEEPIGTPDETVQLVKIVREGCPDIAIVNFQVHPDVIGGNKYCADFPGFARSYLEDALRGEKDGLGVHAVYFNGAQGDTNHINIKDSHGGLQHSRHMGQVIAAGVLAVYSQARETESSDVEFGIKIALAPSAKGTPEQVRQAKILKKAFDERGYDALPKGAMQGVTGIAEAEKFIECENAPENFELEVSGVSVGGVAFIGLPGEPFTDIGRNIKNGSPFDMTVPCCCTNGYEAYFPMESAYDEGGYEAKSSVFKAGVAEILSDTGIELAQQLKNSK